MTVAVGSEGRPLLRTDTERGMLFASRYALELRDDGTIRGNGTDSDGSFQVMFGRFDKTSGRMGWLEQGNVYTVCTGTCVWRDDNTAVFVSPERAGSRMSPPPFLSFVLAISAPFRALAEP